MTKLRVVIVGGGFAGVQCAKTLGKQLSREQCEIVLFDRENHMVFHPLLPEVVGGSLNPDAVGASLRQMLPSVRCRTEEVRMIDLAARVIAYQSPDGEVRQMPFDHVVIACGRAINLGMVPGMADHAFPLKTVGDAMALRGHVIQQLEKAEVCEDSGRRRWLLSFVVVGGGFSGVEAAGEINDLVRESRRFFPNIAEDDISVTIIHSRDEILPEVSPPLRQFAAAKMEHAGVTLLLNARVQAATAEGVSLADGRMVRGATITCTIGTSATPLVERLNAEKRGGRLVTELDMQLRNIPGAWAIGDCASIINAADNQESPTTGQFAVRQGQQVAQNIVRVLQGQPTRPFRFQALGQLCSIGGQRAVAELFGRRISGFLAWCMWRSVYIAKLPSWSRRVKAGADWAWALLFPRDLLHLQTDKTDRVSHAHYQAGDYIFREGEPATSFYVIEKGEVEVLRSAPGGAAEPVAVLVPGDFFGEMALIDDRPRSASVRARTAVEVVIMGRQMFTHISGSLVPLQHAVADAIKRRGSDIWRLLPEAHDVLRHESLTSFIEPAPAFHLRPDTSFISALRLFTDHRAELCCVLDDEQRLVGIMTRTDLVRAIEQLAHVPLVDRPGLQVRGFMMADPVAALLDDSPIAAATLMREHGLKQVPVVVGAEDRRVVGLLRAETLMSVVLHKLEASVDFAGHRGRDIEVSLHGRATPAI